MFLNDEYEPTIDDKRRLAVPFPVRRQLDDNVTGHDFYVQPGPEFGTLVLYPRKIFEKLQESMPELDEVSPETAEWLRFSWSQTSLCETDKQGRICLPEQLVRRAGLTGEVTLVGQRDHLVLWSREVYQREMERKYRAAKSMYQAAMTELKQIKDRKRASADPKGRPAPANFTGETR